MGTNTRMSPPVCENCGRDKQPTYICDACIDKLNAGSRALFAERDAIRAELARATRALERAGFTDHGAEEWKPPIGWGDTGTQRERLIALEDELARVKAESLRVVHDTQRCYFYMTPSGIGWHSEDRFKNQCVETPTDYHDFADCEPVRLERWEDE